MNEKEFNLLDEKWIRVRDKDCNVTEVSLKEVFVNAHEYCGLCGELPTQDVAILRVLLAVILTVFARYDSEGKSAEIKNTDDAFERWQELWENGKFPEKPIVNYLESQRESFWLFHPEKPFCQTATAKIGTEYGSPKLNGELSESGNKLRLFPNVFGEDKKYLSFSQAVRWLIYVNAYDDTSAKPSAQAKKDKKEGKRDVQSAGTGWLGKLGLVTIGGHNLFETLMLNMVMLSDDEKTIYNNPKPIWERNEFPTIERNKISCPKDLAELYTVSSRRLFLKRDKDKVVGYYLLGGDFFDRENAFIEPMTIWKMQDSKTKEIQVPRRHDPSKQFWRSFPLLVEKSEKKENRPVVIKWVEKLAYAENIIDNDYNIDIKIASVQYGDQNYFVANLFSDYLSMNNKILSDTGWQDKIIQCIELCEQIAKYIWVFAKNINLACGGSDTKDSSTSKAFADGIQRRYYNMLDEPFRKWLADINPNRDIMNKKVSQWTEQVRKIALELAEDTVSQVPPSAIIGVTWINENKKFEKYSCAESMNIFKGSLNKAVNELAPKKED